MESNKKEDFDPYSEKGQEANQMKQISPREAKKQPLPPSGSEDRGYLNEAESKAIKEQEFIIRPKPEKKNNYQRGPNKKCRIISYGLINIYLILLLSLAAFYICEAKINEKTTKKH